MWPPSFTLSRILGGNLSNARRWASDVPPPRVSFVVTQPRTVVSVKPSAEVYPEAACAHKCG